MTPLSVSSLPPKSTVSGDSTDGIIETCTDLNIITSESVTLSISDAIECDDQSLTVVDHQSHQGKCTNM